MTTISTYGELWAAVRRQIERDLGEDQIVALCPYGSLFRIRAAEDAIDRELLHGTHAKTIDVIAVVRDMDAALAPLSRALRWSDADLAAARDITAGRPPARADGARWQDRSLRWAIGAFRGTVGAWLLRSAFGAGALEAAAQPCPLYGQMLLGDPLDLRLADGRTVSSRERYKIGVIGIESLLGPTFESDLRRGGGRGYLGGVAELERATDARSSAYVQLRFLGQNPARCLRWVEGSQREVLQAKMHGLSCSAMHAALLLLAADLYPLPEARRVGLRRWGIPIGGASAYAWDELGQLARGISFLAELAVKVMILRKHHSVFGPAGIYAREIAADDVDADMFLDGLNDFLAAHSEVGVLERTASGWRPLRRVLAEQRRRSLVIIPDHVSDRLRQRAERLWHETFARINATLASTNILLQDTHRLLARPLPAGEDGPRRSALGMIRAELVKSRARFGGERVATPASSPIQTPWPLDPDDPHARTELARKWLDVQTMAAPLPA